MYLTLNIVAKKIESPDASIAQMGWSLWLFFFSKNWFIIYDYCKSEKSNFFCYVSLSFLAGYVEKSLWARNFKSFTLHHERFKLDQITKITATLYFKDFYNQLYLKISYLSIANHN